MRVLVTGGAGYLGSVLVGQLIAGGYTVRALDDLRHGGASLLGVWSHPCFSLLRADVRDHAATTDALEGIEAVVHLAAIVGDPACARDPEQARAINLGASAALLESSRTRGVARFVFASTCSNYGKMADPTSYVDESSELRPVSLYAETKVAVERLVLDPNATRGLCATAVRLATLFGPSPRMRFDLTVNDFTMQLIRNRRLEVHGEQFWRPYVHVLDAARAIALVLDAPTAAVANEVFNVGATEENYRKLDLVRLIQPFAPDAVIEYVKRSEDPRDYRVSFEKVRRVLDFGITRSVPNGITELAGIARSELLPDWQDAHYRN